MTDVDLQACIQGDAAAWRTFVNRYARVIRAAVARTVGPAVAAEDRVDDLTQEVFVRLLRNDCHRLRTYDPERAALSTWLTLVARSVTIDELRRRRLDAVRIDERIDLPAAAADIQPTGPPIPIHLLSVRQRLVLRLLFDESRSVEEAASILEVDPQTIRSTKHKALSRLRDALGPDNRSADSSPQRMDT